MSRRPYPADRARGPLQRGVSLIEALLALVVMSLGMLAVVGVQATLRGNSDLSRQRAEAVRLAQQDIETLRSFNSLTTVAGEVDFADIVEVGPIDVSPAGANAVFRLTRNVPPDPPNGSPPIRTVGVSVQWTDRTGASGPEQRVDLFTTIARISPAVSASLSVPPNGAPARLPGEQNAGMPRGAVPNGDGTSTFTPPQPTGGDVTSLIFNSTTGQILKICVKSADAITPICTPDKAQLVTGFIRMALPTTTEYTNPLTLSNAQALDPASNVTELNTFLNGRSLELSVDYTSSSSPTTDRTGTCFGDSLLANTSTAIEYFCVVRLYADGDHPNPTWTGALKFAPDTVVASTNVATASLLRVCQYKPAPALRVYTKISKLLSNQNFLLIAAGDGATANACPTTATAAHQPPPP